MVRSRKFSGSGGGVSAGEESLPTTEVLRKAKESEYGRFGR